MKIASSSLIASSQLRSSTASNYISREEHGRGALEEAGDDGSGPWPDGRRGACAAALPLHDRAIPRVESSSFLLFLFLLLFSDSRVYGADETREQIWPEMA